jgi:hypothetical protein
MSFNIFKNYRAEENTVRRLKEEPLLEERPTMCAIGLHVWRRWSEAYDEGIYIKQYRHCEACGKINFRREIK